MSRRTSGIVPRGSVLGLLSALVVASVLLLSTSCEPLVTPAPDYGPPSSQAAAVETTTTATLPGSAMSPTTTEYDEEEGEPHAEESGGPDAAEDAVDPSGDSPTSISLFFEAVPIQPLYRIYLPRDHGESHLVHVGDLVHLTARIRLEDEVSSVDWINTSSLILEEQDRNSRVHIDGYVVFSEVTYEAIAMGEVLLQAVLRHEDGSTYQRWRAIVEVAE